MKCERNPVGWFEIYVEDMERAKGFYERVLGVRLEKLGSPEGMEIEMQAFPMEMEASGCAGALVKMAGKDAGVGGTIVYFSCQDCGVEAGRVAANGGVVVREKFGIGEYGHIALVQDTEGNMIGLHSME